MRKFYVTMSIILIFSILGYYNYRQNNAISPNNLIRLHVIANSNSFYDQDLKHRIKDCIVSETTPVFKNVASIQDARIIADQNLELIKKIALDEIQGRGYNYQVNVMRGTYDFPAKTYTVEKQNHITSLTLPPGEYEAVRVVIGEGKGANWWCVLYPPLCFVDLEQAVPPVALPIASAMEKGSAEHHNDTTPHIQYRLRIAEAFNSIFGKD